MTGKAVEKPSACLVQLFIRCLKKMRQCYHTPMVRLLSQKCGIGLKVNHKSSINNNTLLGNNVNFNGLRIEGRGKVVIGDNFHSGTECLFITQNHDYDTGEAVPYGSKYLSDGIVIEDNVWIGSRVIVLDGVTIGEGAIIQAGSCVVSDIPKYAVAGGHPARVFKERDRTHYEELKRLGKFH